MSKVGLVLGSGLGAFADTLEHATETPYSQIPGWPVSTAAGHAGKLVEGRIGDTEVLVLAGRAHLYEGYTAQQVTFGIRELARRGVRSLMLTNAAGGINLAYHPGQLVLISDHINLLGANPLTGPNDDSLGPRFPDMSEAYSREYREAAKQAGASLGASLEEGVYAALPGPSYETPAEIRYLRAIGQSGQAGDDRKAGDYRRRSEIGDECGPHGDLCRWRGRGHVRRRSAGCTRPRSAHYR